MSKTLGNGQKRREKRDKIGVKTASLAVSPDPSPDENRLPETENALENP
jgi:hypothetical protein